jgi:hypothetical protein
MLESVLYIKDADALSADIANPVQWTADSDPMASQPNVASLNDTSNTFQEKA